MSPQLDKMTHALINSASQRGARRELRARQGSHSSHRSIDELRTKEQGANRDTPRQQGNAYGTQALSRIKVCYVSYNGPTHAPAPVLCRAIRIALRRQDHRCVRAEVRRAKKDRTVLRVRSDAMVAGVRVLFRHAYAPSACSFAQKSPSSAEIPVGHCAARLYLRLSREHQIGHASAP